jgi:lipoprotein-releasing system permease protein
MFSPLERMMAFRYLRARKAEGFVSVIAAFSFLGIMLGVATLIIVMSVMNGFRAELINRMLGLNGHLNVYATEGPLYNYLDLTNRLKDVPGVSAIAPMIEGQALMTSNGSASGVMVRGFAPDDFAKKPIVNTSIKDGDLSTFKETRVAIGVKMAERLRISIGDQITLMSPKGRAGPFGTIPRMQSFTVAVIFDVGMYEFNNSFVFMPLPATQTFFDLRDAVNSIEIITSDPSNMAGTKQAIVNMTVGEAGVYDWQDTNHTFLGALKVERNVMFIILTLIIIVAAFNIISSMIMLVKDKTRDIAILRTMGAARGSILRIFILTGASVGCAGTAIGAVLGVVFAVNIEHIRRILESFIGTNLFSDEIYFLSQLPARVDGGDVAVVVSMAFALSFLATLYPAWRAAKLDPVEAIRYE